MRDTYLIDVNCPLCKTQDSIKLSVGQVPDDDGGYYLDHETRGQDCACDLDANDDWDVVHAQANQIYGEVWERE